MDSNVTQTTTSSTPTPNNQEVIIGGAFGGTLPQTKEAIAATMPSFSLESWEQATPEDPFSWWFSSTQITLDELSAPNHMIEETNRTLPDNNESSAIQTQVPTTDTVDLAMQMPSFEGFNTTESNTNPTWEQTIETHNTFSFDEQDFSTQDFSFDPLPNAHEVHDETTTPTMTEEQATTEINAWEQNNLAPTWADQSTIPTQQPVENLDSISMIPEPTEQVMANNFPDFEIPTISQETVQENIDFNLPNVDINIPPTPQDPVWTQLHIQEPTNWLDTHDNIIPDFNTIDYESEWWFDPTMTNQAEQTNNNEEQAPSLNQDFSYIPTVEQSQSPIPDFSFEEDINTNQVPPQWSTTSDEFTIPNREIATPTINMEEIVTTSIEPEATIETTHFPQEQLTSIEETNKEITELAENTTVEQNHTSEWWMEDQWTLNQAYPLEDTHTETENEEDLTITPSIENLNEEENIEFLNIEQDIQDHQEEESTLWDQEEINNNEEEQQERNQIDSYEDNDELSNEYEESAPIDDEDNTLWVASYEKWKDVQHELSEPYQEFIEKLKEYTTLSNSSSLTVLGLRTDEEEVYYTITLMDDAVTNIYKSTSGDTIEFIPTESWLQVFLNDEEIAYFGINDIENDITYPLKEKLNKFTMMIQDEYETYQKNYIEAQKKIKKTLRSF